eukprot:SAG11_NODE_14836_length_598_cov_0.733467_1_plen_52_part_10
MPLRVQFSTDMLTQHREVEKQAPASCFRKFVYGHIGRWHGLAQILMQLLFTS